jgi:hypothetical protein
MARAPKHKLLTALPSKFDPNFIDRMDARFALAGIVRSRRAELEAHCGGDPSPIERRLIRRTIWLELLTEGLEQKIANGEEVDVGAITQLGNTLKGYYKDLGYKSKLRTVGGTLRDIMAAP